MKFLGKGFQKLEHYRQRDKQTDRQTDRQTNVPENITTPHARVVVVVVIIIIIIIIIYRIIREAAATHLIKYAFTNTIAPV